MKGNAETLRSAFDVVNKSISPLKQMALENFSYCICKKYIRCHHPRHISQSGKILYVNGQAAEFCHRCLQIAFWNLAPSHAADVSRHRPDETGNLTSNPKIGEASQSRALPHQQHYAKHSLDCSSMWKTKCQLVHAKGSGTLTKRDAFKKKEPLDTQGSSTKELCQSKPLLHCISGREPQKGMHAVCAQWQAARVHLSSSRTGSSVGLGVCNAELCREGDPPATTANMELSKVSFLLLQVTNAHMAQRTVLGSR